MRCGKFRENVFQRVYFNTQGENAAGTRNGKNRRTKIHRTKETKAVLRTVLSMLAGGAVLLSGCGSGEEAPEQGEQSQENVEAAGEAGTAEQIVFEGVDMEGNIVSSSIFSEAKLTMVNVWATYCNPCLGEMPALGELAGEYDAGEFQLIGIVGDVAEGGEQEKIDQAAELVEQTGAVYPHLLVNESLYDAFLTEVTGVPTTFFIDENGVILDSVLGANEKEVWKEKIDALLEGL